MSPVDPRDHAEHDLDALSEALDGQLPVDRLEGALAVVRSCPECRAAYEAVAWTKAQAARTSAIVVPPGLEKEIRRRLDRDAIRPIAGRARRTLTLTLTLAAALVLSIGAILARIAFGPPSLPKAVADNFRARAVGRVPIALETEDPAQLESWLGSAPLAFPTRVFDLRMMGYQLRGGGADTLAGRPSAVIVYREVATGRAVICRMLRGGLTELPPPAETREHDGIPFGIYQVEGLTLVFWPESDVLCVLVSDGEPDALIQLAFAKAMKARAHGA